MKIGKLRTLCRHMHDSWWGFNWKVHTKKQVAESGLVDPPCACLVGDRHGKRLFLDIDCNLYLSQDGSSRHLGVIPEGKSKAMGLQIIDLYDSTRNSTP